MSTIIRPSLSDLVNASKVSGVSLVDLILALDKGFEEAEQAATMPTTTRAAVATQKRERKTKVTRATKPRQTTPTPKPAKPAKREQIKADPTMREVHDGRMMTTKKGSITSGQIKRIEKIHSEWDFEGFEINTPKGAIKTWNMADAADYYHNLKVLISVGE